MQQRIWWLVAAASSALLGVGASVLLACNSGGNDPVSACTGYCVHVLSCEGYSGSQFNSACAQSCADAATSLPCGDSGAAVVKLYNCFEGLPCSDFAADAGGTALLNCVTQSCQ